MCVCLCMNARARQDPRTSADNCAPVLKYSNYAIHCCQKRDKHIWDHIAQKITGDNNILCVCVCVCVVFLHVCFRSAEHMCEMGTMTW